MEGGNFSITGYSADGKFANNMQSYVDFFGENGIFTGTDYDLENAEAYDNIYKEKISKMDAEEILSDKTEFT